MPKCINHRPHHAFEPFLTADIYIWGTGVDVTVGGKSLCGNNHSDIIVQVMF